VLKILGNIALEALHHRRARLLIGLHHRQQALRGQLAGQLSGVRQITEYHGQLPPFRLIQPIEMLRGYNRDRRRLCRAGRPHLQHGHGVCQPLHWVGAEGLADKCVLEEACRDSTHHNAGRWREPLEASRNRGGLAQGQQLLTRLIAEGAENDRAGMNADAHGQTHPMGRFEPAVEVVEHGDDP
jgi:hypothetical protein